MARKKSETANFSKVFTLADKIAIPQDRITRYYFTVNSEDYDEAFLRFDNTGTSNGQPASLYFGDIDVYEGSIKRTYQPPTDDGSSVIETKLAEYKQTVNGQFTTITNQMGDMLRKTDIQITPGQISFGIGKEISGRTISSLLVQEPESIALIAKLIKVKGDMVVDGSILGRHIASESVETGHMKAGSVTTPILANSSPEGARDFLVPSRLRPGQFYALPQAPQQFKQLLMVGGIPRYYQIAPCFRDEDPRADRLYGDFYQLDLEMSFVEEGEVVRTTMEPLIKSLVTDFAHKKLLSEEIPRIPYQEAMNRFGVDKPDLRYGMELIDLKEALKDTGFKVFQTESVKAICVKNGATLSRSQIDNFTEKARKLGAGGLAYIIYENDEVKSPIAKFLTETELAKIKELTGAENGDAVFFGADSLSKVNKVLGQLRIAFADHFNLKDDNVVALCWIVDFPFYEWDEGKNKLDFGHNPFSMPKGGLKALEAAETDAEKLAIVADQYDMVMNGFEICSGAVRNHSPEVMYKVFGILGYDEKYVEARFGGMLNAFKFGAPPHAGCAFGIERIFMVLNDNKNIRDIVAFPKNGSGVDLMMSSPSVVDPIQLEEAHLQIVEDEE